MTADPASSSSPLPLPPREAEPFRRRDGRWPRHPHRGHGIFPGLVVIAWGGLLLLRELGVIPASFHAMDLWPLLLIGFGVSLIVRWRKAGSALVGLAVTVLGAGLLAGRLGFELGGLQRLWPVVIIVAGVGLLWKSSTRRASYSVENETLSADRLQRSVTMGGLQLAVDSQQFQGGSLAVTMGEVRVDLRRAAMSGDEVTLDLSVTMGGIELYVPASWQIVNDVSPFMGAVEDKTLPRPDEAGVQKRLVLRGKLTMGAVTITN